MCSENYTIMSCKNLNYSKSMPEGNMGTTPHAVWPRFNALTISVDLISQSAFTKRCFNERWLLWKLCFCGGPTGRRAFR